MWVEQFINALLNEDKAIVTDITGTTRDTIEAELNLGGIFKIDRYCRYSRY